MDESDFPQQLLQVAPRAQAPSGRQKGCALVNWSPCSSSIVTLRSKARLSIAHEKLRKTTKTICEKQLVNFLQKRSLLFESLHE